MKYHYANDDELSIDVLNKLLKKLKDEFNLYTKNPSKFQKQKKLEEERIKKIEEEIQTLLNTVN